MSYYNYAFTLFFQSVYLAYNQFLVLFVHCGDRFVEKVDARVSV